LIVNGIHYRLRPHAAHDPAVYSRFVSLAGVDQPVVSWPAPLLDFPSEGLFVELRGTIRIIGGDFEMNDSRHNTPWFVLRSILIPGIL
jgi:hypothetical protein